MIISILRSIENSKKKKKIINPLSDKSVDNFKGSYNHKDAGILRVSKGSELG